MHSHNKTPFVQCALTAVIGLTIAGLKVHAQTPPAPEPAAPETFTAPVFTEDFESGELNKAIWETRIGAGGGGGGGARGARGARGAATTSATAPSAPIAAVPPPATAPATPAALPTITIQQDLAAHGKNALLVHYPPNSRAYSFITAPHLPDSLKEHFFGRAYVMFPKAPPNAHDVFITSGTPGFPISNFLEIGLRQNKAQLSYQQNGPNITRGEKMIPGPPYPVGKWFCLEWEFNDNPDSLTIWIDGEKAVDTKVAFNGTADHLVKGFSDFSFGFRSWGNVPNGFDVYYDDIAFGTGRIGPVK